MGDDYRGAPVSIAEARAMRTRDGAQWGPRDVLVSLLREIDEGKCPVDTIFVALGNGDDVRFVQSSRDPMRVIGVVEHAKHLFLSG